MALVTRYFSTSAAGAGDGTTWADRAALISGGAWSTYLTGIDFSTDHAICYVGPGTYSAPAIFQNSLFTNAPTWSNPLTMRGCDSSGNPIALPVTWKACEPPFSTTNWPAIQFGSYYITTGTLWCGFKFTGTRNGAIAIGGTYHYCEFDYVGTSTSGACSSGVPLRHCVCRVTGTAYQTITLANDKSFFNCAFIGNPSATSGNRNGVYDAIGANLAGCLVKDNVGVGVGVGASTNRSVTLTNCVITNNGGDGVYATTSSGQASVFVLKSMLTNNGGYAVNSGSGAASVVAASRARDNDGGGSGLNWNVGNGESTDNYVTDDSDANEYVDAAGGNYTIKAGSTIHGMGFGVAEQAVGGGTPISFGFL